MCCSEWDEAVQGDSGNDAFGALICSDGYKWMIGSDSDLAPINYCPWCGVDKRELTPLEAAARRVVDSMFVSPRAEFADLKEAVATLGDELDKLKG